MKRSEIKKLIKEAYYKVLLEQPFKSEAGEELQDSTDEILSKFPKVRTILEKLMTDDFGTFVQDVEWISPKPTAFRVELKNGQSFTLTWQGEGFTAKIKGMQLYLNKVDEFQKALSKLAQLYNEAPVQNQDDEEGEGEPNFDEPAGGGGGSGGGGGDFPGGEGETAPEGDETAPEGGEGEEAPADLGDEEIDFEDSGENPT